MLMRFRALLPAEALSMSSRNAALQLPQLNGLLKKKTLPT
jgi:hypothetical protein